MADKQMHHLTIGDDTFEIVDQTARAGGSGAGVPSNVRQAISTLLQAAAYTETGLTDEIAIVESWASVATAITVTPSTASISGSGTQQLTAVTTPSGKSVTWTSSDTSVATVSSGGLVTGVSNGTVTITATSGSVSATCTVTVSGFATLTSIDAVYTQSGSVYTNTNLNSLKSDLVVTASYDNGTTSTLTDNDYTLSGTLTEGTSTITVTYSSFTTTFDVTVTTVTMLYNWDLTSSLTDTVSGAVATIASSGASQDSDGVHITSPTGYCAFPNGINDSSEVTIEVDVASADFKFTSGHGRLITFGTTSSPTGSGDGIIYRSTGYWALYISAWTDASSFTGKNDFSGKTLKLTKTSDNVFTLYCDGVHVATQHYTTTFGTRHIVLGTSSGNAFFDAVFSAVRVYEGVI